MTNELDELMDRDPLQLSAQDIDAIIHYQRQARANVEAGIKPKKDKGPSVSLDKVMQALRPQATTEAPKVVRRI